jgi:signal transduction histidine kinase
LPPAIFRAWCGRNRAIIPSFRMNFFSPFFARLSAEERTLFKRQLAALFLIVTLLNLGFYWQRVLRDAGLRHHVSGVIQGWDGLAWYVWMAAAPMTLLLIRRYPFTPEHPWRSSIQLLSGSIVIYLVVTNTRYLLRIFPNVWEADESDLPITWKSYGLTQIVRMPLDFLTYAGLFSASFAVDYYSKFRQRAEEVLRLQLEAARIQSELAAFQLAALRGQLHPHFLFNSFNAISTLVRQRKNELAVETIAQLSEVFRFFMEKIEQPELPFEQELEFIRCYLQVEGIRFGEKLRVSVDVEPATLNCIVPNLLLQPLVENAIKHGIARRMTPGEVRISAKRRDGRLLLEVSDDGPGESSRALDVAQARSSGIGLRNTRQRLDHLYGANYRFQISPRLEGGTTVVLDLPWKGTSVHASTPKKHFLDEKNAHADR